MEIHIMKRVLVKAEKELLLQERILCSKTKSSEFLYKAAQRYKKAQAKLYNIANKIKKLKREIREAEENVKQH